MYIYSILLYCIENLFVLLIGNFVSIEQRRSDWLSQAAPFLVLGKKVWYNNIIGIIRKDK